MLWPFKESQDAQLPPTAEEVTSHTGGEKDENLLERGQGYSLSGPPPDFHVV